jgi:hypothetical protein
MEKHKLSTRDKELLLSSLDHLIDAIKQTSNLQTNKDSNNSSLSELSEIRKKLILSTYDIKIHIEDDGNKYVYDSWYAHCYICGTASELSFPKNPSLNGHFVCKDCFKKYYPGLFERISSSNKKYWDNEDEKFLAENGKDAEDKRNNSEEMDSDLPF